MIVARTQKEKRRTVKKVFVFLENTYIVMNRILVEICMVKASLIRSQTEMKNTLLESGEKTILVIK